MWVTAVLGGEQRWVGSNVGWGAVLGGVTAALGGVTAALGGEQRWVGSNVGWGDCSTGWGAALGGLGFQNNCVHTRNLIIKCQSKLPIQVVLTYI